ncbi:MAG: hypothetical protein GVY18_13745 [Bacteroidetes bacterium]|nr:hypothetical protein [Bacteroidota bacterium]
MSTRRFALMVLAAMLAALPVATALGQDEPAAADEQASVQQQWEDFLHYIGIARPKLAKSYGEAILANEAVTPKQIYMLSVQETDSMDMLGRARNMDGLSEMAERFLKLIERGYKAWRSDPDQIANAIKMLGGTLEGYRVAVPRLQESGEYAVPMLLQKLSSDATPKKLRTRIVTMLPKLGKQAVRPYSVALQSKDLQLVEWLAHALGAIEYPHAVPQLKQALERPDIKPGSQTGKAIIAALISCGGGNANIVERSTAELWYELGNKYYYRADSLQPDSRYPNEPGLVWVWKGSLGVEARPVPREIFCDVYAMRCARMTLQNAPDFHAAVPLWLTAAMRRQIELPQGKTDPLWPADVRQADYYALASSPVYLQTVLGRALRDGNVPLAKHAINILRKTTGAKNLVATLPGGAQPLVAAMGYPDRTVRFLAALTLALAQPTEDFLGSQMVMNQLSQAVRQTGTKYALVVVADETLRNTVIDAARGADYEVISVTSPDAAMGAVEAAGGLDVMFVGPGVDPVATLAPFRREVIYGYVPAVVNRSGSAIRRIAEEDGRMVVLEADKTDPAAIAQAFAAALALSAGQPLDEEQAVSWAIRASRAIEAVAARGSTVYSVSRCTDALVDATDAFSAELQIAAAEALAVIGTDEAQQAVVALALNADADEQVRIAAFKAATKSVRQFGREASDAQAQQVLDAVTGEGSEEFLQAAAQLLGAMNLPSEQSTDLILGTNALD